MIKKRIIIEVEADNDRANMYPAVSAVLRGLADANDYLEGHNHLHLEHTHSTFGGDKSRATLRVES